MFEKEYDEMKKLLSLLMALAIVFSFAACGGDKNDASTNENGETVATPENAVIRMATTTSVDNAGLLQYLEPHFEAKTGYDIQWVAQGTGKAIQSAKDGNADLILVHAKASEEEFISEGYGIKRIPFMYNYFVLVGPKDDPAGVKDAANAAEAFGKIAQNECTFTSRGDDSGTHKAEIKLWGDSVPDAAEDEWYLSVGSGMGDTLTKANEMSAYCFTDKATFLANKDSYGDLEILISESEDLKNTYSVIECNPEKLDDLNNEGAKAFIEWITSDEAAALIAEYGKKEYGEALFMLIEE